MWRYEYTLCHLYYLICFRLAQGRLNQSMNASDTYSTLQMKNGTVYEIHPCIEPGTSHNPDYLRAQIVKGVENMSPHSRWHRFAMPVHHLSDKQLDYLTALDGSEKVAWCALIHVDGVEKGIGLARYARLTDETSVAEFAITVIDEYQGQGVGHQLLSKLLLTAADNSIKILRGYILPGNLRMIALCRHFNANLVEDDPVFVIAEIPLS